MEKTEKAIEELKSLRAYILEDEGYRGVRDIVEDIDGRLRRLETE